MHTPPSSPLYSHDFYGDQAPGSARSADVVLPLVFELLQPASLVDIGCGIGTWARAAMDLGVQRVVGVDGDYVKSAGLRIPADSFVAADLATAIPVLGERFDMAISLEVAEHLPAGRSDAFVGELCGLADTVVFSAAIPGQLGTDHINLQLQSAWASRFRAHGYVAFDLVRPRIWHDERVEAFYRQNMMVYVNEQRQELLARAQEQVASLPVTFDVVHPELLAFWLRRANRPVSTAQGARLTMQAARHALTRRLHR